MKTKKNFCLLLTCLLCLLGMQANVSGAPTKNDSNAATTLLDSDDPYDYFEGFYFIPHYFTLFQDEELVVRMIRRADVELPENMQFYLMLHNHDNSTHISNTPPAFGFNIGENEFELRFNMSDPFIHEELTAGNYDVLVGITFDENLPNLYSSIGILEFRDFEPISEEPKFMNVSVSPVSLGSSGILSISFTTVFTTFEEAEKVKRAKIMLSRSNGNEPGIVLFGSELDFPSYWYSSYYSGYEFIGHTVNIWFDGNIIAGDYEITIDFNCNTPNEGEYVWQIEQFNIPEPPVTESTMLVHTEYGLYEASQIGNMDIFDLIVEDWKYGVPGYQQLFLFLLPANTTIGNPGWDSYRYRLLQLNSIQVSDGTFRASGINMAYEDNANSSVTYPIVPGDYILVFNLTGYMITHPITVFEGKTQINPVLTGIEAKAERYNTLYTEGDCLDLAKMGMVVRALYDIALGGREVTDYTTTPADGSVLSMEDTEIIISYTENSVTQTTVLPITVVSKTDNWTAHTIFSSDIDCITIEQGSGNHLFSDASCKTRIVVESGYSGIIRFKDFGIDISDIDANGVVYSHFNCMTIEQDANVVLELIGSNTLNSSFNYYRSGIRVKSGAVLSIESDTRGKLTLESGYAGIRVDASGDGGTLLIRGNAIVNTSGASGIYGGISDRSEFDIYLSTIIITGSAEVTASGHELITDGNEIISVGIGGGTNGTTLEGTINGHVFTGGSGIIIIDGDAKVNAYSELGAAIGGGRAQIGRGGDGGIITIGGNAQVMATSDISTAIGGGRSGANTSIAASSGVITIKDNAFVTAIGYGPSSCGIGIGPSNSSSSGARSDIRITGGTVNASSQETYSGHALGGFMSGAVKITGGSVYNGHGDVSDPQQDLTTANAPLYMVKLIVQDQNENKLDNIRLLLDGYYEVETGKNSVWNVSTSTFTGEIQHGVAYVWLLEGERSVEIMNEAGTFTPQHINVQRNNDGVFVITLNMETSLIAWKGISDEWYDEQNWPNGLIPMEADNVLIPSGVDYFPDLTDLLEPVELAEIHFAPDAQIGGQSNLRAKAFVNYDFSSNKRNRWNMLSIPLGQVFPGDFVFGGYPLSWVRKFTASPEGSTTKGAWKTINSSMPEANFSYGDGFVIWLDADGGENDQPGKGLKKLNNDGFLELPYFHNFELGTSDYELFYKDVNLAHEYTSGTTESGIGTSTFYNFTLNSESGEYERGGSAYDKDRTNMAYQLAGEFFSSYPKYVEFSDNFALIGNPFMATLDFDKFSSANSSTINSHYYVWMDNTYKIYHPDGGDLDKLIAPLQGFIVEQTEEADESATLSFNELQMTSVNDGAGLRSSSNAGNKLDILARNPVAGVRTFIAKRDGGQETFGNLDARKIMNAVSDVPEVYTLKPYKNGSIASAVNIINSDELLIPVGLATSYVGEITLTFNGMDSYDAQLSLIDAETKRTIDLTGLDSYNYTFDYTPGKVNGEAAVCENRFFIRISRAVTGLDESVAGKVNVFESNGFIGIISSAANPIKEVAVYDLQGVLIYKANDVNAVSHTVERNLLTGVYVVKVVTEKSTEFVKFVKL